MVKATTAALIAALFVVAALHGQSKSASPLEGVWQVTEVTMADGTKQATPQPGLLIVKGRHYSDVRVFANEPRPNVPAGKATAEELRAMWGQAFIASAGTFELVGNNQTTSRAIVAKNPGQMNPKAFTTYSYKLDGNTLSITGVANQNGPIKASPTVKYTRVE
jgi:hypothetical protein